MGRKRKLDPRLEHFFHQRKILENLLEKEPDNQSVKDRLDTVERILVCFKKDMIRNEVTLKDIIKFASGVSNG